MTDITRRGLFGKLRGAVVGVAATPLLLLKGESAESARNFPLHPVPGQVSYAVFVGGEWIELTMAVVE